MTESTRPEGLPPGVCALVGAVLPALVAWNWNTFEELASQFTDGGPLGLTIALAAFLVAWLFVAVFLHVASRRPVMDGAVAGVIVALVMVAMMVRIVQSLGPGNWPLIAVIGLPFYALSVGLGTAAGLVARKTQGTSKAPSRAAGIACIIAGGLIGVGVWTLRRPGASTTESDGPV